MVNNTNESMDESFNNGFFAIFSIMYIAILVESFKSQKRLFIIAK